MWRVTVCTDQIKQDEIRRLRSTYGEEKKYTGFWGRKVKETGNFEELDVGGNILKRTLNARERPGCERDIEPSGFYETCGIS